MFKLIMRTVVYTIILIVVWGVVRDLPDPVVGAIFGKGIRASTVILGTIGAVTAHFVSK